MQSLHTVSISCVFPLSHFPKTPQEKHKSDLSSVWFLTGLLSLSNSIVRSCLSSSQLVIYYNLLEFRGRTNQRGGSWATNEVDPGTMGILVGI